MFISWKDLPDGEGHVVSVAAQVRRPLPERMIAALTARPGARPAGVVSTGSPAPVTHHLARW